MIPAWAEGVLLPSVICVVIMVRVRVRRSWLAAGLAVAVAGAVELTAGLAFGSVPWVAGGAGTLAASLVALPAGLSERRHAARQRRRAAAARVGRLS
ncbi:MAG: hypothetical protein ACRDRJ_22930 [Streptosporangiaceae bacterium]